jgi:hypothetical protein
VGACLKLTPQQIEAFVRLRTSPDFKRFEEVVREYEDELTERVISAIDALTIHRTQGSIHVLQELRRLVDSAPETLKKLSGK